MAARIPFLEVTGKESEQNGGRSLSMNVPTFRAISVTFW